MPFYESQPTIYPLHRLLEEVLIGEVRVPRFQRPGTEFTWRPEQRGELLDSIYRGFPIGTILLWATSEKIRTIATIGRAEIPPTKDGVGRLRLILDGHQRLSSLISILGPGLDGFKRSIHDSWVASENWVFDLDGDDAENLSQERFKLLKQGERPNGTQIPLSIALNRVSLNKWVRDHKRLSSTHIRLADSLRDRFREYNVPVATLAAESLDVATETFKRINSSGTRMSDFHMVSALAYTDSFDPQEQFETVRSEFLDPEGWGEVDDSDTLRVCAGLVRRLSNDTSQHPSKLDISRLGQSLRSQPELITRAGASMAAAARLLREVAGVHGPGILPYSWQLIVLAIELGSRRTINLTSQQSEQAARWFWLTTYGGVFAGVNSSIVDRAGRALTSMLAGGDESAMKADIASQVEEAHRFDFRSARSRACLLAIARLLDKNNYEGRAHRALATGSMAVHTLYAKDGRSTWYNLIIEDESERLRSLRDALRRKGNADATREDLQLLKGIGIERTDIGSIHQLLLYRRERLALAEQVFVSALNLQWHQTVEETED